MLLKNKNWHKNIIVVANYLQTKQMHNVFMTVKQKNTEEVEMSLTSPSGAQLKFTCMIGTYLISSGGTLLLIGCI